MEKIVFASKNKGKVKEIKALLADMGLTVLSLDDFPDIPEIEEDGRSFYENALKKAKVAADTTGEAVIADDSGLEVDALNGAPGIYSARYAGDGAGDKENIAKLLYELKNIPAQKRGASFRCVLVFYEKDKRHEIFEGRWEGVIAESPSGTNGFGYDPVFYIPERKLTAAQLSPEEKNRISHRGQAFNQLKKRLDEVMNNPSGRSAAR